MMLAYMTEKKVHDFLLTIFHERNGTQFTEEGAYTSSVVLANKKYSILSDVRDDSGLLFNKIVLDNIVAIEPNLAQFNSIKKQLPELDESVMEKLAGYDTSLTFIETLTKPIYDTAHTDRELELFKKTRALLGLGNLCFTESFLLESGNYFTIQAAPNCPYYTGTIRVKIK